MKNANFRIIKRATEAITIKDLGPWDQFQTVTNDAEGVVDRMVKDHGLQPGQRLFYEDSDGAVDELLIDGGKFAGFKVGSNTDEP